MATIKVPEEILSDIKDIADEQGRSPHWIMLEAIKKYVQEAKQAIEDEKAWLQSGVDALKNAETHGYAYTADEMNKEILQIKETVQKTV
jgi:predicted transcriptional regulator